MELKGSSSEQSPLNLECTETCSTKPDSCSSIDYLNQSFSRNIFISSVGVVSVIFVRQLIYWYVDGSKNYNILRWSNATQFLRGNWIRDKVDWGNLPQELLGEIGKCMVSELDIAYFRCVCKKWRSSLPSPTRFPLWLPPPPTCDPDIPYTISEATIWAVKGAWYEVYMRVDQGRLFKLDSFSTFYGDGTDFNKASVVVLASQNLKLSQLSLLAKSYFPCMAFDSHKRMRKGFPRNTVLISCSNAYGGNPSYARASDLSVVSYLVKEGSMRGRLALLRLGGPPRNWTWDTDFCTRVFAGIATYKGQLCTLDCYGSVFVMDYNSLQFTRLCDPLFQFRFPLSNPKEKILFEAWGDLYLADYRPLKWCRPVEFYKLNLQLRKWVKADDKQCSMSFVFLAPLSF